MQVDDGQHLFVGEFAAQRLQDPVVDEPARDAGRE